MPGACTPACGSCFGSRRRHSLLASIGRVQYEQRHPQCWRGGDVMTETLRKQPESSASAGDQPARCPIRNATSVTLQAAPLLGRFCSIGRAHRGDHSSSLIASAAQASAVRRSIADDSPGLGP